MLEPFEHVEIVVVELVTTICYAVFGEQDVLF
jgi:hypothetical protein